MQMLDGLSLRLWRRGRTSGKDGVEQAAPRRQELGGSAWLSALLIGLLVLLAGILAAGLAGELQAISWPKISLGNQAAFRQTVESFRLFFQPWLIHMWAIALGCLTLLGNRAMFVRFLAVFPQRPVGAMISATDLEDLDQWLNKYTRPKWYFVASVLGGIILGFFLALVWQYQNANEDLTASLVVVAILSSFLAALALTYIYPFYIVFPSKLGNYQFDLFTNDPASSAEIKELAGLYTYIMLITMGLLAFFTLGLMWFDFIAGSTWLFMILFVWGPTIAFFFISQSNINNIIITNKRAALDALQHQIEALYDPRSNIPVDTEKIPKKDELDRVDKLVALHERIKGYPNTSLDLRGFLNVITILLLPLITWILNYAEPIRKLINQMTAGE
jgi:hypothetical protein